MYVLKNQDGFGCIYKITNIVNNKKYIGQTSKYYINDRWAEHRWNARIGHEGYLYNAMRKYGEENFVFNVVLHDIPIDKLNYYEEVMIKKFNTFKPHGYNLTKGGGGTRGLIPYNKGMKRPEVSKKLKEFYNRPDIKAVLSERIKGSKNPMYGRTGKNSSMFGKRLTGEMNGFYGKHHTEEAKQKISDAHSKTKQPVIMLNDKNEIEKTFDSYGAAARYIRDNTEYKKADDSFISKCARGQYPMAYGYKWKKKEEVL